VLPSLVSSIAAAAETGASELYAESAATVLAVQLLISHGVAGRPEGPVGEDARVARAVDFMPAHLGQQVRLADIAGVVQLSPYHFLRVFKNATGQAPSRYLTSLRVAEAGRRLGSGSDPVSTIAYDCGFSSPAHLAATFLRETGMSPTAYRRLTAR
jgi:AraC family transcriptional regulator